jgi:hypothetical protein
MGTTANYVVERSFFAYTLAILEPAHREPINTTIFEFAVVGTDYECHSPDTFRIYHLKILLIPHTDLLAIAHSLRVKHAMTFDVARNMLSSRLHGVVAMCAQRRRTKTQLCVQARRARLRRFPETTPLRSTDLMDRGKRIGPWPSQDTGQEESGGHLRHQGFT